MTVNQYVYHLIVMLASMLFLAVLIISGHDSSPLLNQLLTGVIGGTGGAGIGQILAAFFKGPPDLPSAPAIVTKTGGFIMMRLLLLVMLGSGAGIACVACASLSLTSNQSVAASCATASAAVKSITVLEKGGYLSPADISVVNQALTMVNPICEAPTQPTYAQATISALASAVADLSAIEAKYHAAETGP